MNREELIRYIISFWLGCSIYLFFIHEIMYVPGFNGKLVIPRKSVFF